MHFTYVSKVVSIAGIYTTHVCAEHIKLANNKWSMTMTIHNAMHLTAILACYQHLINRNLGQDPKDANALLK